MKIFNNNSGNHTLDYGQMATVSVTLNTIKYVIVVSISGSLEILIL